MTESQKRAVALQGEIEKACIKYGLNLTIYEEKIGFVDHAAGAIVMLWTPKYTMPNDKKK